ncbi:MAG: diguanylate cyclase [Candidatus Bipolaricaulota bacterium]|nr:diguanylate cyclase [Candidatus Bipolaricaulota bacterium]
MRLRAQIIWGMGFVAVAVLALLFGFAYPRLGRTFTDIEQVDVRQDVDRATNALAAELSTLEVQSHDWASWDDTAAYVAGTKPSYVDENLSADTFMNLHLNLIAFFDASGRLVLAQAFDLDEGEAAAAPEDEMAAVASVVSPGRSPDDTSSRAGLLSFGDQVALVAIHPILNSAHEPPVLGTLVIGRTLGPSEVDRLAAQVALPLSVRGITDPRNDPGVVATLLGGDPARRQVAVVPLNAETVAGYTVWRDLSGVPVAVLGVEVSRDPFRAGLTAATFLLVATVVTYVLLGGGFLWFLDSRVLSRTARLTRSVAQIARDQDPAARVAVVGKDELGGLAENINGMLAAIEESSTALVQSERRYHNLFDSSRDPIYITAADGHFVDVNPALVELFGYSRDQLMTKTAGELYARPEDRDAFRAAIAGKGFVTGYPVSLRKKDGTLVRCLLTTIADKAPGTGEVIYQGIIRDVTELLRQQEELTFLATHDPLTGLLTRSALNDVLSLEIARAMRNLERLAVFYLDLDKFKQVNDIHGHAAGDRVLRDVAARLREALRASDTVARLGGDEFVALLPGIDSPKDAELAAEKILQALRDSFSDADLARGLSASIGIALYPDDGDDGTRLLQKADAAMYNVKNCGRDGWKRYDPKTDGPSRS